MDGRGVGCQATIRQARLVLVFVPRLSECNCNAAEQLYQKLFWAGGLG